MKIVAKEGSQADLANPASAIWEDVEATTVSLQPVPLSAQPNEYIRVSRADRPYGQTANVAASAASCGDDIYVRLEWQDDEVANTEFADAAAVVLGSGDGIGTLGSDDAPMTLWYWANDRNEALNLSSVGPGVVRTNGSATIAADAELSAGRWSVVLAGPASAVIDSQLGVAVWNGSNDERAGLAAVSDWLSLDTE